MNYYKRKRLIGDAMIAIPMILIGLITIYPFLNVLAVSFNDSTDTIRGGLTIFPREVTLRNYIKVLTQYDTLPQAALISVLRTVIGTVLNVIFTSMVAFTLSRQDFMAREFVNKMFVVTMYVSGGMIPSYILIKSLGLYGNFWVYIIPGLVWAFCIFIVRTYIEGLPISLQESAMIDGASDITIYAKIIMPLCKPSIATVALYYAVNHWNSWFDTYLYCIRKEKLYTLQFMLQKILQSAQASENTIKTMKQANRLSSLVTPLSIQMAITVLVVIPIIILYPFLQKYFIKGMTLGAVKG